LKISRFFIFHVKTPSTAGWPEKVDAFWSRFVEH